MKYSTLAAELWNEYADEFNERWGIDHDVSAIIGARSKKLFAAEFTENGIDSYRTSVVLPIRNAFYAASVIDERWEILGNMNLREPLLDYGCGVGFTLLWLKRQGFTDLYGYEVEGVQRKVLESMASKHDIKMWQPEHAETVLCINVLEHVADPCGLLDKLMSVGKRVIANICTDYAEHSHIAPQADLEKCREILDKHDGLFISRSE